jgi:FlaA1/EpsC-like NDP-sugar epimerase
MTRFWLPISEAAEFFRKNYHDSPDDRPNFPPMKAASVVRVISALATITGVKDYRLEFTGIRAGEKIHETLVSTHDFCVRSDTAEQFTDADLICLLGPYVKAARGVK